MSNNLRTDDRIGPLRRRPCGYAAISSRQTQARAERAEETLAAMIEQALMLPTGDARAA